MGLLLTEMTPQHWQQVKAILIAALECESSSERAALVERSCRGDLFLREEVESLLAYDDDTPLGGNGLSLSNASRPHKEPRFATADQTKVAISNRRSLLPFQTQHHRQRVEGDHEPEQGVITEHHAQIFQHPACHDPEKV